MVLNCCTQSTPLLGTYDFLASAYFTYSSCNLHIHIDTPTLDVFSLVMVDDYYGNLSRIRFSKAESKT